MKPAVFHSEASVELDQAIAYYEERVTGLGLSLLTETEKTILQIRKFPQLGTPYKETGYRRCLVHRFPFAIFYLVTDEMIWIAAISHTKRRPGYWSNRDTHE